MKHHIVVKFLAVFLCAVSLLGAVGSGLGMFAIAEMGLNDRTVEDAYQEYAESYANNLAQEVTVRYASQKLGGASAELVEQYYGSYWLEDTFDWSRVGYVIRDAEGNVLQERELYEAYEPETFYDFPVDGQYLNVLNIMTEEEYNAIHNPVEETTVPSEEDLFYYNEIPQEGADVFYMDIGYNDGSVEIYDDGAIGHLYYSSENQIGFEAYYDFGGLNLRYTEDMERYPTRITCLGEDMDILYQMESPNGILEEYSYRGGIVSFLLRPMAEEVVVYDAIPVGGAYVSRITVTYADDYSESTGGVPDIGFLNYDTLGRVVFTASAAGIMDYRTEPVTHIAFHDTADNLLYEATDPEGVGNFYLEDSQLIFRAPALEAAMPDVNVYIYDDVPPQTYAVHLVELWLEGGSSLYTVTGDNASVGIVDRDENGNVYFRANNWKDFAFSKPANVLYISLADADGRVLYESYEDGTALGEGSAIGVFAYSDSGDLVFTTGTAEAAALDVAVAQETLGEDSIPAAEGTLPERTEETIEPTEETLPEPTAAETAPMETMAAETIPDATEAAAVTVPEATETPTIPEVLEAEVVPETAVAVTEPTMMPETAAYAKAAEEDGRRVYGYYDYNTGNHMIVEYTYEPITDYTVEVFFADGAIAQQWQWVLLEVVYQFRDQLFLVLAVCLLVFAIMAVYLCCAAGKKPGTKEIHAGGLNCIPLDLYAAVLVGGIMGCAVIGVEGAQYLVRKDMGIGILFVLLVAFAACLLIVGFCFACAAQFKTPGGFWWRNSLCGWCLKTIAFLWNKMIKGIVWLGEKYDGKLEPMLVKCFKALWKLIVFFWGLLVKTVLWLVKVLEKGTDWLGKVLEKGTDWLGKKFVRFFSMLPVTWQWLLVGFVLVLWLFLAVDARAEGMLVAWAFAAIAAVLYGAHAFGVLLESAKRMSKGDLDEKVDDKLLIGSFKEFSEELNGLADVAVIAAQKQLKSERMKTELITNVSHDIKTPLTSIINYVDLLQKPHNEEEQEVYLEVLDRQSQRLKKLIEDLMEMSKASTGNLSVDIGRVDAGETINQALGEFADKLDKAQLIPVFRQPEKPVEMMADGRLVWRVMSNLLGNAVKYALPGTRVYLDLTEVDGKVIISMKNISREELNVNADELLERFVRGDASRNTEGSGLGLNIAQSLMELQKGQLQLLVDGDLFKVTLIFPGV